MVAERLPYVTYRPLKVKGKKTGGYLTGLSFPTPHPKWKWLTHVSPSAAEAMEYGMRIIQRYKKLKEKESNEQ